MQFQFALLAEFPERVPVMLYQPPEEPLLETAAGPELEPEESDLDSKLEAELEPAAELAAERGERLMFEIILSAGIVLDQRTTSLLDQALAQGQQLRSSYLRHGRV